MKATVFYLRLTREQVAQINDVKVGWNCDAGRAYLDVTVNAKYEDAQRLGMIVRGAEAEAENAEQIWVALQNGIDAQSGAKIISRDEPRSMSVGDLIVWEDGRIERCASVGFEFFDLAFDPPF